MQHSYHQENNDLQARVSQLKQVSIDIENELLLQKQLLEQQEQELELFGFNLKSYNL
jgi:hypothetical protein